MRAPSWWPGGGLWRRREFLRLWAAQIVSAFGSRITRTALPVLAVVALAQDDGAMGALAALPPRAEIAGPAAAGALIGLLGAPLAVLIDGATYLWSAAFLGAIRTREAPQPAHATDLRGDLAVGVRAVFGPPLIRRLVIAEMALAVT